jgi:hypothetical protein
MRKYKPVNLGSYYNEEAHWFEKRDRKNSPGESGLFAEKIQAAHGNYEKARLKTRQI